MNQNTGLEEVQDYSFSEVNTTWLITSELANQRARKALFTCVVYANGHDGSANENSQNSLSNDRVFDK